MTSPFATKAAQSDMRLARREGEIAICDTYRGTLFLSYLAGQYSVTSIAQVLVKGKASVVLPVLAALYVVVA
jgi:hypothetical protein